MKSRFYTILIIIIFSHQLSACDICGCSSGNYFLGLTPHFHRHFFGLRYSFQSFNTVLKNDASQFSNDFYQTAELWGGFKIRNKFQIMAFIPYNINHSVSDDGETMNQGLGDMTAIFSYNMFNNKSLTRDTLSVGQQLWIGIGVKAPTGHFSIDTSEVVSSANSQTGTGSFDFLLTASYYITINDWQVSSDVGYKINEEASGFKFGNRFTANVFASRTFQAKRTSFIPNVGLLYEYISPNQLNKTEVEDTGASDLLGAIGLETTFNRITFGFNAQLPIAQNISNSQTKVKVRGMVHLTYAF